MRDDARRKEQQEQPAVPLVGNEYPDHTKQKTRVHDILRADGWKAYYEQTIQCHDEFTGEAYYNPYTLDVYALKWMPIIRRMIAIGVEIHREEKGGGHGSKITGPKDRKRALEILNQHRIVVIPFNVSHMKAATDETILEEIYQRLGLV